MQMPSLPDCLLWEPPSAGVSLLRINRPEVRNALNLQLRRALADAFRFLASDRGTNAIGLVSDLVDDANVLSQALAIAGKIAALPTVVACQVKQLVLDSMNVPLEAALRMEMMAFQLSFASNDKAQQMRAFLDGRRATR